jgi:hypothetical protein
MTRYELKHYLIDVNISIYILSIMIKIINIGKENSL